MKSIETWLEEYGVSHQNPTNKLIHWICVPLIFFSIVGFFYSIKLPVEIAAGLPLNLALLMLVAVTVYYFLLSKTLALGMLLFSLVCAAGCYVIETAGLTLWIVCASIFVLAWVGQFYGHNVEGKKPSFLKDLQYLMIGPAWLMSFVYRKLGISL
ncbi:MAG: DUF962 domain-containing protein [Chitinophagales bacterium]|nr:DUF962 domain-containing protein [Chitinophagales bacterium]